MQQSVVKTSSKDHLIDFLSKIPPQLREQVLKLPELHWLRVESHKNQDNIIRIGLVGEVNRGKTTLLNEFLGFEFGKTGRIPVTASLAKVLGKANTAWEQIEFWDTPGLNSMNSIHSEITYKTIPACDLILLCIRADLPLSQTERVLIQEKLLPWNLDKVIIAFTFGDKLESLSDKEEIEERVRTIFKNLDATPCIFWLLIEKFREDVVGKLDDRESIFDQGFINFKAFINEAKEHRRNVQLRAEQSRLVGSAQLIADYFLELARIKREEVLDHGNRTEFLQLQIEQLRGRRVRDATDLIETVTDIRNSMLSEVDSFTGQMQMQLPTLIEKVKNKNKKLDNGLYEIQRELEVKIRHTIFTLNHLIEDIPKKLIQGSKSPALSFEDFEFDLALKEADSASEIQIEKILPSVVSHLPLMTQLFPVRWRKLAEVALHSLASVLEKIVDKNIAKESYVALNKELFIFVCDVGSELKEFVHAVTEPFSDISKEYIAEQDSSEISDELVSLTEQLDQLLEIATEPKHLEQLADAVLEHSRKWH